MQIQLGYGIEWARTEEDGDQASLLSSTEKHLQRRVHEKKDGEGGEEKKRTRNCSDETLSDLLPKDPKTTSVFVGALRATGSRVDAIPHPPPSPFFRQRGRFGAVAGEREKKGASVSFRVRGEDKKNLTARSNLGRLLTGRRTRGRSASSRGPRARRAFLMWPQGQPCGEKGAEP